MNIDFAVVADYALLDQQGKLSVVGIFQHVLVPGFPAVHPRTFLVLRVSGRRTEIGGHVLRIRFLDPDGHELLGGEGTAQFGEPPAGVTDVEAVAVLSFDLPFPKAGSYTFDITLDGGASTRVPLAVSQIAG